MKRSHTFEVIIEVGGKPEIEGIYEDEKEALKRAEYLLALAKYTAVRVNRIDSRGDHKVIFEKTYSGSGRTTTVSTVDEAFICETAKDVFRFESRQTLLKLLRSYFDQRLVIPAELLHDYLLLRYLERDATLFSQAMHRLSALQARATGSTVHERYDELSRLFRATLDFAKDSETLKPYAVTLATRGLTALVNDLRANAPPDDHQRLITYALAQYLREYRDWSLKLGAACALYAESQSGGATEALDEVLAEIIDGNEPVRSALGYAPDLITALEALLATAEGTWDDRLPGTPALQKLNDVMAHRPLPRVRAALLARIAGALEGTAPLTRMDRSAHADAFNRFVPKLIEVGGFMGGVTMSTALTRRAKIALGSEFEDLSFEGAVRVLLDFLPNPASKVGYLLDLLSSDHGRKKATHLTHLIAELFNSLHSIYDFAQDDGASWSEDGVREAFRSRLTKAGIPRRLADGLLRRLARLAEAGLRLPEPSTPQIAHGDETIPHPAWIAVPVPRYGSVVLNHRGAAHVIEVPATPFVIGRSDGCQLVVAAGTASRSHARIEFIENEFVLVDHSKNGTYLRLAGESEVVALTNQAAPLTGEGIIALGMSPDDPAMNDHALIAFQRVAAPGA